jgi:hypothetical protein
MHCPPGHDFEPYRRGSLRGRYFRDSSFLELGFERQDSLLDWDWRDHGPARDIPSDHFSVRWEGYLFIDQEDDYTFVSRSDDGVRILIDCSHVIVDWEAHSPRESRGRCFLTRGWHEILVEFREDTGGACLRLEYARRDEEPRRIPASSLAPPDP